MRTAPAFTGWLRQDGGPWHRVCEGATWDDCYRALLRVPSAANSTDRVVRPGERHPDHRRKPR